MSKRDPWQREPGAHEIELRGRKYRNMVLYTRPCLTCQTRFGIYVTQQVADGNASNNNFGLKNCEIHRHTRVEKDEHDALRTANATMREELTGLYARNREVFEELQRTKAKLATYELSELTLNPNVFEDAEIEIVHPSLQKGFRIGCEPVQNTSPSSVAFPWNKA